ncbi:hypothetical protein ACW4FQ_25470, partial [Escherichia coli]
VGQKILSMSAAAATSWHICGGAVLFITSFIFYVPILGYRTIPRVRSRCEISIKSSRIISKL